MEEMIKRINQLLSEFNNTFELEANIEEEDNQQVVTGLRINGLKNDGTAFVNEVFEMFGQIISSTGEYELLYDDNKGLIIGKEVVKQVTQLQNAFDN